MILAGLVVGRWWAIPLGGIAWAALVLPLCDWDCLPSAALLGAANTAAGVAIHLVLRPSVRAVARRLRAAK